MAFEAGKIKIAGFRVIYGPSTIGRVYEQAAERFDVMGMAIDLRYCQPAAAGMPLPPPQWLEFAREEADAVFFGFPSDFKALGELFGNLIKTLDKPVIPVTPEVAAMRTLPADIIERAVNYHIYGGKENIEQFF